MALLFCFCTGAQSLVILTSNDTHSSIDPDEKGRGGILQRMALIDSVRAEENNLILVDAGDAVQGSLYFKFFKGDVEYPLFNMMGYDVRILGNHEFDNGMSDLANYWKDVKAHRLSANYDFSDTPAQGLFSPFYIKNTPEGKVGFFGINVDPASLISEENYEGMKFSDPIQTANRTASLLRNMGCDLVVAVTHIGYKVKNGKADDLALAAQSKDIDVIIGGHSHTVINPADSMPLQFWVVNEEGREVLVTQTGKNSYNLGYISLNPKNFNKESVDYHLIPITNRFEAESLNPEMSAYLAPYKHLVDSVNARVIGEAAIDMPNGVSTGAYPNWTGDFGVWLGRQIADSLRAGGVDVPNVDMAIMNVGGIRHPMRKGIVTEGQILSTFPFANKMRLIEISGADLLATMEIVAPKGGEAVSSDVMVYMDADSHVSKMTIGGRDVVPDKKYVVATIDYVANGNDDMVPMKRHREIWRDNTEVCYRILDYIYSITEAGNKITVSESPRFIFNQ